MTSQHKVYVFYYYIMPQQYNCIVCGAKLLWNYNQEYNSNCYVLRLYVILPSLCSIRTNYGSIGMQDRQYAYKRNNEARSLNFFLPWKTNKYYILWVCVCSLSYPLSTAHASYYIVICGLSGSTIFFHINKGHDFRKNLLNKKGVLWFPV